MFGARRWWRHLGRDAAEPPCSACGGETMKKDTAWRDMMAHPGPGNGPRGRNMPHDGEEKG